MYRLFETLYVNLYICYLTNISVSVLSGDSLRLAPPALTPWLELGPRKRVSSYTRRNAATVSSSHTNITQILIA